MRLPLGRESGQTRARSRIGGIRVGGDRDIEVKGGFAAPGPRPKALACGLNPTPIEEPTLSVVSPPSPVLAVGALVGWAETPKLPPKPVVPTLAVGDDAPLRPVPKPAAALLVPVPKPVAYEVTLSRPAPSPTPGELTIPALDATSAAVSPPAGTELMVSVRAVELEEPREAMRRKMESA